MTPSAPPLPVATDTLSHAWRERIGELVAAASGDEPAPLNDDAWFALEAAGRGEPSGTHWLLAEPDDDSLIAYAHVAADHTAQLVVTPRRRRQGWGGRLVAAISAADPAVEFWAFGDSAAAQALARRLGWVPVRTLLQMTRVAVEPVVWSSPTVDIVIRAFRAADADQLLAVNAQAFAHHPEQGRWTRADLDARLEADWFDPAGLLVAELRPAELNPAELIGFHWTKVAGDNFGSAVGEVYILAVDPAYAGRGLGRSLLAAGLDHLERQGIDRVFLYVESSNTRVVHLYERSGFWISRRDVRYASGARFLA